MDGVSWFITTGHSTTMSLASWKAKPLEQRVVLGVGTRKSLVFSDRIQFSLSRVRARHGGGRYKRSVFICLYKISHLSGFVFTLIEAFWKNIFL
jgi:hypothetical protein